MSYELNIGAPQVIYLLLAFIDGIIMFIKYQDKYDYSFGGKALFAWWFGIIFFTLLLWWGGFFTVVKCSV